MDQTQEQAELMAELTFELTRTCHEKERFFASMFNLTSAEFRCLRFFKTKDRLPIKELCNIMKISPGRITHILTKLEEKKLIVREKDPDDRRGINVVLTSKCQPYIKNLNESHVKLHADILSGIEPDKRDSIITAIEDLIRAIKSWSERL
jgi:MarR family transcriptional regulator, multiple antibiotic resistance protein MarR